MTHAELAAKIDHTILKAEATEEQVREVILYAKKEHTASVCLNPCWVPLAAELLAGSGVAVCTVIGFPLGATTTAAKVAEAKEAYAAGATELDMVLNIGALKSGLTELVARDIRAVVEATPGLVKVILEVCYLTDEQIELACKLCAEAKAAYVKTSTGFGPSGATVEAVRLMRAASPAGVKIKAAGGIGSLASAQAMLNAGADRLGASRTAAMLAELDAE